MRHLLTSSHCRAFCTRLVPVFLLLGGWAGCSGSVPPQPTSAQTAFDEARQMYNKGKWEKARLAFEIVVFNHPGSSLVDSAQFLLAMCHYKQNDPIVGAAEFLRIRTRYPTSPLVDQADLMRCRCLLSAAPGNPGLDQEQTKTAIDELQQFKDNHPLSEYVTSADTLLQTALRRMSQKDFRTGVLYYKMGQYRASRVYLQEMIDRYTESPLVPDALYYMAEGQRESDSLKQAVELYEKLIYLYPDHSLTAKARKRVAKIAREQALPRAAE